MKLGIDTGWSTECNECPGKYAIKYEIGDTTKAPSSGEPRIEQQLFTVSQFCKVEPAFTEAALRNLIFKAASRETSKGPIKGNGLLESGALVRVGRRVLIHRTRFTEWATEQKAERGVK